MAPPTPFPDAVAVSGSLGSIGSGLSTLTDSLFGTSESNSNTVFGSATKSGTSTKQLEIDEEGVNKILADILGSEQGLASIFSKEQVAGLYDSTVAAQGAGDLVTKLAGEIAKLQAKETTVTEGTSSSEETTEGNTSTAGLFDFLGV